MSAKRKPQYGDIAALFTKQRKKQTSVLNVSQCIVVYIIFCVFDCGKRNVNSPPCSQYWQ